MKKVAKFGGTSLADGNQFKKIKLIAERDKNIYCIITSAPGKRDNLDTKITDMLYICYEKISEDVECAILYFNEIKERFNQIILELNLNLDLSKEYLDIEYQIRSNITQDFLVSRGEYFSGIILSNYLGYEFIDPYELIYFDQYGKLNENKTYMNLEKIQNKKGVIIPGFYGRDIFNNVKTFPRGGSDITGAIVARGIHADIYENWTDVSGVFVVNPKIVKNPHARKNISYTELNRLSTMGADVYHKDAIYPVMEANIPIHIRNTNDIHAHGTYILDDYEWDEVYDIVGIVGKAGYYFLEPEGDINSFWNKDVIITSKFTAIFTESIENTQLENEYCVALEMNMEINCLLLVVLIPNANKTQVYNSIEEKLKEYDKDFIMCYSDTENNVLYIGIDASMKNLVISDIYYKFYGL